MKWAAALAAGVIVTAAGGFTWYHFAPPPAQALPLPDDLIAVSSEQGRHLLVQSAHKTDHGQLQPVFAPQRRRAFCGPATSATVLNAVLPPASRVTQFSLFDTVSGIKSELDVSLSGLSLEELAQLLRAHGLAVHTVYAGEADIADFRRDARSVLSEPHTFLVVNYDRAALEQEGPGHISPLGAYHAATDRLLVMDVAAYRYPHTWVPLDRLWEAMSQPVGERTRGYLIVRRA